MTKVKMIQTAPYSWKIESEKGVVLVDGISLASPYQANEYVGKWVTSFNGWTYDIIPLKEFDKKPLK